MPTRRQHVCYTGAHGPPRDELVAEALDSALRQAGRTLRERLFNEDKANFPASWISISAGLIATGGREDGRRRGGRCAAQGARVRAKFREQTENSLEILREVLRPRGIRY